MSSAAWHKMAERVCTPAEAVPVGERWERSQAEEDARTWLASTLRMCVRDNIQVRAGAQAGSESEAPADCSICGCNDSFRHELARSHARHRCRRLC